MLKIEGLSVNYGSLRALTNVDLEVQDQGILHGVIGMLAEYDQLIRNAIDLRPFGRQQIVDVIQHGSNSLLIGRPGDCVQVGEKISRVAADSSDLCFYLHNQIVGVVGDDGHLAGDLIQTGGFL